MEPDYAMRNSKDHWRVWTFRAIEAIDSMPSDADGDKRTNWIFRNMPARVYFEKFICFLPDAEKKSPSFGSPEPMTG